MYVVMLSVVMLGVVKLSVVMLSVVAPTGILCWGIDVTKNERKKFVKSFLDATAVSAR